MWNHDADPSDFLPINDRVQLFKVRVTMSRATIFLLSSRGFRLMPDADASFGCEIDDASCILGKIDEILTGVEPLSVQSIVLSANLNHGFT